MAIKAIFVGINYGDGVVYGCSDLKGVPFVYAKSMLVALTDLREIYEKNQCRLFTDADQTILGVTKDKPTKENVKAALRDMVSNAKEGDTLLFYFCGHGCNEYQTNRGALRTLHSDLNRPDVIYSDELEEIVKDLSPNIHIVFLIHACFSGAMFSYNPGKMKGIALTSVGPDIPSVVERKLHSDNLIDFTTFIRDKVIKKLPKGNPQDPQWPMYSTVSDGVKEIIVKGIKPDGISFEGHAEIYNAPGVDPASVKFLQ